MIANFEIVVTSVRNMWRQRSPCTSGWPATLLMNSFKRNPLILYEPKLCFIIRWKACLEYITISQGNTIWIRSDQQTIMKLANTTKSLQNCFYPKHLKLPQGPPGVPQWTPPQKYLQHNSTWAIVEVFTIIVFEKGKLLGERLARQVWNVDLDSTRHLDGLEVRRVSWCIKWFWIVFDVFTSSLNHLNSE